MPNTEDVHNRGVRFNAEVDYERSDHHRVNRRAAFSALADPPGASGHESERINGVQDCLGNRSSVLRRFPAGMYRALFMGAVSTPSYYNSITPPTGGLVRMPG